MGNGEPLLILRCAFVKLEFPTSQDIFHPVDSIIPKTSVTQKTLEFQNIENPPTVEACRTTLFRIKLTDKSKLNDCECIHWLQNGPSVDVDFRTISQSADEHDICRFYTGSLWSIFVRGELGEDGKRAAGGGAEPLCTCMDYDLWFLKLDDLYFLKLDDLWFLLVAVVSQRWWAMVSQSWWPMVAQSWWPTGSPSWWPMVSQKPILNSWFSVFQFVQHLKIKFWCFTCTPRSRLGRGCQSETS